MSESAGRVTEKRAVHNIFISWAKEPSQSVAKLLFDWIPTVIQASRPFVSSRSLAPGERSQERLAQELEGIDFGLVCVTAGNQSEPWLNFEAGALSKHLEVARVVPLALDIELGHIQKPLGNFQAKTFSQSDMLSVMEAINAALGHVLEESRLASSFKRSWPDLEEGLMRIRQASEQTAMFDPPKRSTEDMFEEIVVAMREQSAILLENSSSNGRSGLADIQFQLTNKVISRVLRSYGETQRATVEALANFAKSNGLDRDDWAIIHTAPFLTWYLEHYYSVNSSNTLGARIADNDDVPF